MLTYDLPGDGTLVGFLEHLGSEIGDSAIELVLQKFGINVSNKLVIKFVVRIVISGDQTLCNFYHTCVRGFDISL